MDPEGRRRDALIEAGLAIASDLSLPSLLQKIVELASQVADARYGALGVLGPDGMIQEFITHGVTAEERRAIGHIPTGKGILGALIHDAKPLRLRRIQDDPRSVGFPGNHPPMRSFLGVPVKIHDRVYGNLYLTEKRGAQEFTDDDQRAVVTLASQAAAAIENARLYEETRSRQRLLEALAQVTQAILAGGEVDRTLHVIARHARELAGAELATVVMPDGDDPETLSLAIAEGPGAEEMTGTRFPASGSISMHVMRSGKPLVVPDASRDDRVDQPLVRRGDVGPAAFVSLGSRDRAFGTLAIANRRGGAEFSASEVEVLRGFAAQAAVALEYGRLRAELQRLALMEDRERIAKELHDGVVQALFAVGMGLEAAGMMIGDDRVRERLSAAVDDIDSVIRDLRNYIFGLRPGVAADRELERALRDLTERFAQQSGLAVAAEIDTEAASELTGRAADVVQIVREAVSNAIRHSGADLIVVRLASADGELLLEVQDNGKGFDPESATRGHGLDNLEQRAKAVGGRLEIESDAGTAVRLRIPR